MATGQIILSVKTNSIFVSYEFLAILPEDCSCEPALAGKLNQLNPSTPTILWFCDQR